MKKLKFLFVLLMIVLLVPFAVFAEGEENVEGNVEAEAADTTATEESDEVKIYFFRGEGCPHCQEAEEWFSSIEGEYGSLFQVVDYETWYNEDNAKLMQKVAEARGETAEGVPYIIIGNKSWNGFAEDYEEEILAQIQSEHEQDVASRYDIMKLVSSGGAKETKKESSNDVLALIVILVIVGAVCFGVYKARSSAN